MNSDTIKNREIMNKDSLSSKDDKFNAAKAIYSTTVSILFYK